MKNKIAQVVVDLPVEGPFDYEIPLELSSSAAIGQRILVSFHTKIVIGYIVGFKATSAFKRLKPILSVLDKNPLLSFAMLDFAKDFSKDYCCSWGQAIATFLPAHFRKVKKEVIFSLCQEQEKRSFQPETLLIHDFSFKNFWPILFERIHQAMASNEGVIFLVPEVDRIPWVVQELKNAGMSQPVSILDKQLTDKEQLRDWVLVKEGKTRIVVGTRSAIFAPVASLGLIIILDENNFSYKQDQSPFYHARHVALMRAAAEPAHLVFVARAASAELYQAVKKKKVRLMEASLNEAICPTSVIDMSNYKYGRSQLISIPLSHAIEKVLAAQGKVLLVMNKKGFGSFGVCAKCQHILKCPRCDVPLTFLYESKQVACRYCNHHAPYPSVCPQCHGAYLNFTGIGIEKLESEIARFFPSARVQCYAKENSTPPRDFDILIATQAVLRLDGAMRFDLTCAVQIDAELNRLDFQAAENVFSLLVHLRAMTKDTFFLQTHLRDNYCFKALIENKPALFYKNELALRKELHFPPFANMAEIVLRSTDEQAARRQADLLFDTLIKESKEGLEILPPQVLSLARLREQYRFVIVVKSKSRKILTALIRKGLTLVQRGSKTIVTVNCYP